MHVLVTGATGFLGSRLVDQLIERGMRVRALVRATSNTESLQARAVPIATASLHRGEGLADALADIDAVVHCAGGGLAPSTAALYADNVTTTRTLMSAIVRHRPDLKRLVLVSSISAHGPSPNGLPRPVSAPRKPTSEYGRCKARAEEVVLEEADKIPVTILRPPAIYGPGDRRMLPLFRAAKRGWVPLPSASRSTSLIHVDDCARALCGMVHVQHPSGRCYHVEDGTPRPMDEFIKMVGGAVGNTPRILRVPGWVLRIVGTVSGVIARMRSGAIMLTPDKVNDLIQPHWVCDAAELRKDFGWSPHVSLNDGLLETAHWYRQEGWLP